MFDFLKDVVSKVPDYGHSDAAGDDRTAPKRRLVKLTSWLKEFSHFLGFARLGCIQLLLFRMK